MAIANNVRAVAANISLIGEVRLISTSRRICESWRRGESNELWKEEIEAKPRNIGLGVNDKIR